MASRELYSSTGKSKKRLTFGQVLGDSLLSAGRTALGGTGLDNIITDDMFASEEAAKFSNQVGSIINPIKQQVLSTFGMSSIPTGPDKFAKGGLRTFEGNTHEEGGIPLGNDEVEGSETMFPIDNQSDFIFSDRILYPKSKESFATKSKRIESKYKLRPNDPYGRKSQERELKRLAIEQETVKSKSKPLTTNANHMAMGGMKYADGGPYPLLEDEAYVDDIPFDTASIVNSLKPDYNFMQDIQGSVGNGPVQVYSQSPAKSIINNTAINRRTIPGITPSLLTPKGYTPVTASPMKPGNPPPKEDIPYNSNFTLPALGYVAQALTNIPALFTKPDTINSSRVKFDRINLAEARNEARRSRNLGLAASRGIAAQSGDTGQAMNYLSGTTAAMNSQYGNLFNQSLMQEKQANSELNMREQLANSEIEKYEEGINTAEKDAIRNLKMQAAMNMGTAAAMAGKDYMINQGADAQINALMGSNPDYTYKIVDGKLVPVRIRAMGGKRGKY